MKEATGQVTPTSPNEFRVGSIDVCINSYVCECSYFFQLFSSYEHLSAKSLFLLLLLLIPSIPTREPHRRHQSRSRRDPCTLERVAGAQCFFPAGVDKTIPLISVHEALFFTYVSVKYGQRFALSRARISPDMYQVNNRQHAQTDVYIRTNTNCRLTVPVCFWLVKVSEDLNIIYQCCLV